MAQYILYELWNELTGKLEDATAEDVQLIAETFDDRTQHFSTWTKTLGQEGNAVYRFLAEQGGSVTYQVVRQQFSQITATSLPGPRKMAAVRGRRANVSRLVPVRREAW